MNIAILGIDLGKNLCSVVGVDETGAVVLRRRMRHQTIVQYASGLPRCVMAMEACCGAHHLGRILQAQGHEIRLMSPEYVRPYVKAQKNDDRDAEAIAEAASRPTMRFVELKSQAQLDIQSLHRVRSRLVGVRTALINQLRAILLERGTTVPQGRRTFERAVDALLAEGSSWPKDRTTHSLSTCEANGMRLINALQPLTANLSIWRARTLQQGDFRRCLVSGRSRPRQ